jgi:hypothetical protein
MAPHLQSNPNSGHVLQGAEIINSPSETVFAVLTDIQYQYQRIAGVQSIHTLTPKMHFGEGFQWRESRRVLYLREDCIFTVQHYNASTLTYRVVMDDGFNRVFYSFEVQPLGPQACAVNFCVDCRAVFEDGGGHTADGNASQCQPSERLARMMAKQDGMLVKRLKAHVESTAPSATVQCF